MSVQPEDHGQWASLGQAAFYLGLSVDTLRRRVKSGALESRKVPTRHGPTWQVRLDESSGRAAARADVALPVNSVTTADLVLLTREFHQQLLTLAERIGYLQAQLQQAEMRISTLRLEGRHRRSRHATSQSALGTGTD
jgi:hypothetical protein